MNTMSLAREDDVTTRLRDALDVWTFRPEIERRARQLMSRLAGPTRIGILGPNAQSRSDLANTLAGGPVLTGKLPLPPLRLIYGTQPQAVCTYANGGRARFRPAVLGPVIGSRPVFVEVSHRLPALQRASLLVVPVEHRSTAARRAVDWAASRCDIVLWTVDDFGPEELTLWTRLPHATRARSLIVVDGGGEMPAPDDVDTVQRRADGVAREVRAVASRMALEALLDPKGPDTDLLVACGGSALLAAIGRRTAEMRGLLLDAAESFLAQHASLFTIAFAALGRSNEEEEEDNDEPFGRYLPQPELARRRQISFSARSAPYRSAEPAMSRQTTAPIHDDLPLEDDILGDDDPIYEPPEPDEIEPAPEPSRGSLLQPNEAETEALKGVVVYLFDRGAELSAQLEEEGPESADAILDALLDDATWLSDYLGEVDSSGAPCLTEMRDAAADAADLIQLMAMEGNAGAAADAACLILQIRRDIQGALAA